MRRRERSRSPVAHQRVNKQRDRSPIAFKSYGPEKWRPFSNFYLVNIEYDGIIFPSVEHAYQANKFYDDPVYFSRIVEAPTASDAKRMANQKPWVEYRYHLPSNDKTKIKLKKEFQARKKKFIKRSVSLMKSLLEIKFSKPFFERLLLSTGDRPLGEITGKYAFENNPPNPSRFSWTAFVDNEGNFHNGKMGEILEQIRKKLKTRSHIINSL